MRVLRQLYEWLYGPLAAVYDPIAHIVSLGEWQIWVLSALPWLTGPRVLELGPGPGHLQAALQTRGIQAYGIEPSNNFIHFYQERYNVGNRETGLINGYAQSLPFANRLFSQVVITFPAPFLLQTETLAEIQRVLTPDGFVVILPAAQLTFPALMYRLAASVLGWLGAAPRHNQSFIELPEGKMWRERFVSAGFSTRWNLVKTPRGQVYQLFAWVNLDI